MSTSFLLSEPSPLLLAWMEQPTTRTAERTLAIANRSFLLFFMVITPCLGRSWPQSAGTALGKAGNGDRQMACEWNFARQRAGGGSFRGGDIGICAHVILDVGEIGGDVRRAKSNHDGLI